MEKMLSVLPQRYLFGSAEITSRLESKGPSPDGISYFLSKLSGMVSGLGLYLSRHLGLHSHQKVITFILAQKSHRQIETH